MGRRNDNQKFTLPGGHAEPDETIEVAARRELREEAGLEPKDDYLEPIGHAVVTGRSGKGSVGVYAFRCQVDGKPDASEDPDNEVKSWEWIDIADGIPDDIADNLHSPRNVTLQALGLQTLRGEEEILDKGEAAEAFDDLAKMALAALKPGVKMPSGRWDYSHLLPEQHRKDIRIAVHETPTEDEDGRPHTALSAILIHRHRGNIGSVRGDMANSAAGGKRSVQLNIATIIPDMRGKGLGPAVYEAFLAHAMSKGATHVGGDAHSSNASSVHQKIAAKHGMQYEPQPNEDPFSPPDKSATDGAWDFKYGPYQYALKCELLAGAEELRKAADTPEFRQWFAGSKLVDVNGKPQVFYRGVRRPELKGYLPLQSFTDSPDIASIYAAQPPSDWQDEHYTHGSSVFPVHIKMSNPLTLKGHAMHFDDILKVLQYGKPNGITHEEATKVLNYLINRNAGKVKAGAFNHQVYDDEGEEQESNLGDLLFGGRTALHDLREDFKYSDDFEDEAMAAAQRLKADTFAYVDSPRFKEVAKRLGYDGVIHDDVFDGAASAATKLLDKAPVQLQGVKAGGYGAKYTHPTYRPFDEHQIVSVYDDKPHHPAEAAAEAPPAPVVKSENDNVKTPDHDAGQKPPRYLYHVTYHNRLPSIAEHGLHPNQPRSIGAPSLDGHARGKLFFSDDAGVHFWHSRAEQFAEHNSDNIAEDGLVPMVLRVPEHYLDAPQPDDQGSRDSLAEALTTTKPIQPRHIEYFDGRDWTPIRLHGDHDHLDAIRTENDGPNEYGEEQLLHFFKEQSPFFPAEHHFDHVPARPLPPHQDGSHYPKAGATVDGFLVGEKIPNMGSIGSTLSRYTSLGVRELPFEDFGHPDNMFYAADDWNHAAALAEQIKHSGRIDPLIVVHDKEGPYILEGAHRFVAMHKLGAKTFPALVVRDDDSHEPVEKFAQALDFWYGDRLEKMAVSPHDTLSVARAQGDKGQNFVDVGPDLEGGHAEARKAFREHVLDKPEVVKRSSARAAGTSNASAKSIWKTPQGTFMAKAYHEKPAARTGWVKFPIQGWAELTNQALYHAAGIGDLHQDVHVAQIPLGRWKKEPVFDQINPKDILHSVKKFDHAEGPALIVRFASGAHDMNSGGWPFLKELSQKPHIREQARRIALMDFLTGNLDRHGGNLMHVPSTDSLLALDHSRSFQYAQPFKWQPSFSHQPGTDMLSNYVQNSTLRDLIGFPRDEGYPDRHADAWTQTHDDWRPTFDWWHENKDKVGAAIDQRLKSIKNDVVREHIRNNFNQRHVYLSQMADFGTENFGRMDWPHSRVDMDPAPKLQAKLLRAELATGQALGYPFVMEEDMTKGLKHKLWNLAAATALTVTPAVHGGSQEPPIEIQGPTQAAAPPIGDVPVKPKAWTPHGLPTEMHPIAHLESSFGRNVAHSAHSKGDYHTAFGAVGFKPVTAHEEYRRSKAIQALYPNLQDEHRFTDAFKSDPLFYNMLAGKHFSYLKAQLGGDPVKAAYGWRWGVGAAQNATDEDIAGDDYVRRYTLLANSKPADVRRAIDAGLRKTEELQKMAIADVQPGKLIADEPRGAGGRSRRYDYSHLVQPHHPQGLTVEVSHHSNPGNDKGHGSYEFIDANAYHNGKIIGSVSGPIDADGFAPDADLDPEYHNMGIGRTLYTAAFRQAQLAGATNVWGNNHTIAASRVHRSLAREHGMKYRPEPGAPRGKRGDYRYALKSERDALYGPARAKIVPWMAKRGIKDAVDPDEVPHGIGETLAVMLGGHSDELRQAAQILSGRRDPLVDIEPGEDPVEDVMKAYGIQLNDDNRRALAALVAEFMQKSEHLGIIPTTVAACFPEAKECAAGVEHAFLQGLVYEVKLGGKHSKGIALAMDNRDPTLPAYWLLKPGSGRLSPAKGIRELPISQTRREAAFSQVARHLLPHDFPETHILLLNGEEVAAIRVLTKGYVAAQRIKEEAAKLFAAAKHDGRLYMWAALDYVLGNVDRHGGNVLIGPEGRPVLIDHGSTLAGNGFAPGSDSATYVPYYLRSWIADWKQIPTDQKRAKLPEPGPEQEAVLEAFLAKLGPQLAQLHRYAEPALEPAAARLNWLRSQPKAGRALLDAWMGLNGPEPTAGV